MKHPKVLQVIDTDQDTKFVQVDTPSFQAQKENQKIQQQQQNLAFQLSPQIQQLEHPPQQYQQFKGINDQEEEVKDQWKIHDSQRNRIQKSESADRIKEEEYLERDNQLKIDRTTIHNSQEFQVRNILDFLELQDKRKGRSLKSLITISGQKAPDMKYLMIKTKLLMPYVQDLVYQGDQNVSIKRISPQCLPYSDQLIIWLAISMSDQMPEVEDYGPYVVQEIKRLEKIGEALIEFYFLVSSITDPQSILLTFNDIENLKIQMLKYTNINEYAQMFDLNKKMLTNEVKKGGRKREPFQIIQSMVGALALWAGVQPAIHFLKTLKIIKKKKAGAAVESKEEEKEEVRVEDAYEFSSQEQKAISSETDEKIHSNPKDEQLRIQVENYLEKISTDSKFQKLMKMIPEAERIEQCIAQLMSSNSTSMNSKEQNLIYSLAFVDLSFIESQNLIEKDKSAQLLTANFHNLKLRSIGSSYINLMWRTKFYIQSINDAHNSPASKIEEAMVDIMSHPWQSYCLFTKFFNPLQELNYSVPLVLAEKNELLRALMLNYEHLFRYEYGQPGYLEVQNKASYSQASTQASTEKSLSSVSGSQMGTSAYSQNSHQKKFKGVSHLFDSNPSETMLQIAENFIPEFSNILCALVGATYIASNCSFEETTTMANYLLNHDPSKKFPHFQDMTTFFSNYWLDKKYSKVLKLHFTVDLTKLPDHLYYKAYIQTLEIRRVKFKPAHTNRCKKFFLDLRAYIELSNTLFEYNQEVSKKPLTPYEYILFHQSFRKVFKNNMTLEQAKKVMPAAVNQSVEEEKKEGEQNVQFEKRAQEFVNRILKSKKSQAKQMEAPMMTQILEIIANNIDTDIKSGQLKAIQDKNQNNSQRQIDIMFYIENAISSYALIKQNNKNKSNQQQPNVLLNLNEELQSVIANKSQLFRDDIDLSSQSVVARDLFTSFATVEDCFDFIEETEKIYYAPKLK